MLLFPPLLEQPIVVLHYNLLALPAWNPAVGEAQALDWLDPLPAKIS